MGDGGGFRKLIEWSWNFVKVVASRSCICLNLRAAISPAAKMRGGFPEQFELNEQRDCGEEMQKGVSLQYCTFTLIRSDPRRREPKKSSHAVSCVSAVQCISLLHCNWFPGKGVLENAL